MPSGRGHFPIGLVSRKIYYSSKKGSSAHVSQNKSAQSFSLCSLPQLLYLYLRYPTWLHAIQAGKVACVAGCPPQRKRVSASSCFQRAAARSHQEPSSSTPAVGNTAFSPVRRGAGGWRRWDAQAVSQRVGQSILHLHFGMGAEAVLCTGRLGFSNVEVQ